MLLPDRNDALPQLCRAQLIPPLRIDMVAPSQLAPASQLALKAGLLRRLDQLGPVWIALSWA